MEWNALAGTDLPTVAEQEQAAEAMRQFVVMNQQRIQAGLQPLPPPEMPIDLEAVPLEHAMMAVQHRRLLLDIETDSMVYADEQQDRKERMEMVTALSQLGLGVAQAAQLHPALAKFGVRLIEFASQGWRVGRDFQTAIDELEQALATQPGDPNASTAQEPLADFQARNQIAVQRMGAEAQIEQATGTEVDGGLE
jgi:hypothetical protein